MKMASRNIANMHLFLEMKKKFPYLPEDTLRNYVFLCAEDQEKCVSLLQKESDNHYHRSQQFSDFRFSENKFNFKINENMKGNSDIAFDSENLNVPFQPKRSMSPNNSNIKTSIHHHQNDVYHSSPKTGNHPAVVHILSKSANSNAPSKAEIHSAPIIEDTERPFISMYKSIPESSHNLHHQNNHNRMMFSTTKEHIIQPPETLNDIKSFQVLPNSNNDDSSKRHAVKLRITPVLPFQQQQQMNIYSNAVCATASHSSRPGRHTTSLNLQLQPHSSDQFPLEISTVPTSSDRPCNNRDFGSHVQISVGAQGTTFTALRYQRPPLSQNQNLDSTFNQLPVEDTHINYSQSSSQAMNSKTGVFPTSSQVSSGRSVKTEYVKPNDRHAYLGRGDFVGIASENEFNSFPNDGMQPALNKIKDCIPQANFGPNFQTAPDYIKAVKKHQRVQLNLIQDELSKEKEAYSKLKSEVARMEHELVLKNCSSYAEVIKKLKEDNRQLRLECNYLLMEYDMSSKGQIPVGVTDEDFYSNIFTGPNDGLALNSHIDDQNSSKEETSFPQTLVNEEEEFDEKNSWKCKKCTFVNHPALEKCEICEISKHSGYVEFKSNYSSSHIQLVSPPENQHKRAVGSVQISVTRRIPTYSKSVKFHVTHRRPR